jgi:protein TonB
MAPVTFVCDLCGAPGRAEAPGAAQCKTCGQVALVGSAAPSTASFGPDPFEAARREAIEHGTSERVDLVLQDEVVDSPARLASLWVAPGRDGGPTPEPGTVPAFRRVRRRRRALASVGALVASGALALGAAVVGGFIGIEGADEAAGETARSAPAPQPRPAAEPYAPPALAAEPRPTALGRPAPAAPTARPSRAVAATRPVPAPEGERLPGLRVAAPRNPAPVDRQCVPRTLRERGEVADRLPDEIRARFPVGASGAIGPVELMGDVPDPEVAEAIEDAIRGCPFVPGADEEGRPISLSVVMRIRFAVQ